MPYPRRLLNEGEELNLDLRPHWWYFASNIFTGVPLLILFFVIRANLNGDVGGTVSWVWGVVALLWAGWLGLQYVQWNFTHFVVTSDRVIFRTGFVSKHGVEIPLERINNINFHQRVFERIIGAGDLEIESAGRDGQSTFDDVRQPEAVQQEIYKMMEQSARKRAGWSQTPAAAAPSPASQHSIPEQLEQLAGLRDRGVISAAEFEAKKAELLERM